jgi:hypothetical protein
LTESESVVLPLNYPPREPRAGGLSGSFKAARGEPRGLSAPGS